MNIEIFEKIVLEEPLEANYRAKIADASKIFGILNDAFFILAFVVPEIFHNVFVTTTSLEPNRNKIWKYENCWKHSWIEFK